MLKRVFALVVCLSVIILLVGNRQVESQPLTTLFLPVLQTRPNRILITEFMASNTMTLFDEDGDSSDWIEIQNKSLRTIDLKGYFLTDDEDDLTKWEFPEFFMGNDQISVVFASDKDRTGDVLHTNFKLKSGGEYLALVAPDGVTIMDEYAPEYPPQSRDVSYGIDPGGFRRYFNDATPKEVNPADPRPIVREAEFSGGNSPVEPIKVTALVEETYNPITSVRLIYRIGFGAEQMVTMTDSGNGEYTGTIPANIFGAGDLVRWYVLATADGVHTQRWPIFANPENNAEYLGTVIPDASVTDSLPIFRWYTQNTEAAATREGTRATVFYNGELYDNVFVRVRGLISATYPKKPIKFEFNRGQYFEFDEDEERVEEVNLITTYTDASHMRVVLSWDTYKAADNVASISFPMRVERNGSFYGILAYVEQPDEIYLERNGLDPDGAFYKFRCCNTLNSATEAVTKQTREYEDNSDLRTLVDGLALAPNARRTYMLDNVNIPAVINYLAATVVAQDYDYAENNYYMYRDTEDSGEWRMLPWDKDKTFGLVSFAGDPVAGHPFFGSIAYPYPNPEEREGHNRLIEAIVSDSIFREMYLRRLRSVMDITLNPNGTPLADQFYENRIVALKAELEQSAALDADLWESELPFSEGVAEIFAHVANRRSHLYGTLGGLIPAEQMGSPTINFGLLDPAPVSGDEDEEYFTLENPHGFAVDISGWEIRDDVDFVFDAGTVIPANGTLYVAGDLKSFRSRAAGPSGGQNLLAVGDYSRNLDNEAGVIELYDANGVLVSSVSHSTP